jgi:hypothetical protein
VWLILCVIQDDSGGKVNIFGGDKIGYYEKKVCMNMCLILNSYRDRAVRIWPALFFPASVGFLFVGLDENLSLQNKGG